MNIQSRMLTVDFYNCKAGKCSSEEELRAKVSDALRELDLIPLQIMTDVQKSGHISLMALLPKSTGAKVIRILARRNRG